MKVFISQPMNGIPHSQILEMRTAAKRTLESYYNEPIEIIDSYVPLDPTTPYSPLKLLGNAISKMADADLICVCDNIFEYSGRRIDEYRGCRIEYEVAIEYKVPIVFLSAIQGGIA